MARLKDILQQQRKKNFVGRQKEIAFFENLLRETEPSCHLLYIYGPGGQGKTTLLRQFGDSCKETGVPFLHIDCRYVDPHPESFEKAVQTASPFNGKKDLIYAIDQHKGPVVLMIDTDEKLKPLDDWFNTPYPAGLPDTKS